MAGSGNFDYSQFANFAAKIQRLKNPDDFVDECAKKIAAELLKRVIQLTLPGQYPKGSGRVGGTLRRGWTAKTHKEAEKGVDDGNNPTEWAETLPIKKSGNTIYIEVLNPVEYAEYVEYGHRTRGGKSWVPGKFMLKISTEEVQNITPALLEKKIKEYLRELL